MIAHAWHMAGKVVRIAFDQTVEVPWVVSRGVRPRLWLHSAAGRLRLSEQSGFDLHIEKKLELLVHFSSGVE